jgi:hypothetical protein
VSHVFKAGKKYLQHTHNAGLVPKERRTIILIKELSFNAILLLLMMIEDYDK